MQEQQADPIQIILELAYIKDPKLFDRDAATRISGKRVELKKQTSWLFYPECGVHRLTIYQDGSTSR
jgi:hypothetical protein